MPRLLCLMPFGVEVMVDGFFDNDSDNFCQCRLSGISFSSASLWLVGVVVFNGEFDPGSGRTLAACLTHASRAERLLREYSSGERVSNTWVICPGHRNNQWKR